MHSYEQKLTTFGICIYSNSKSPLACEQSRALNWAETHVSSHICSVRKQEQAEDFRCGLPGLAPPFPTPLGRESGHSRQPPAVLRPQGSGRGGPDSLGTGRPACASQAEVRRPGLDTCLCLATSPFPRESETINN